MSKTCPEIVETENEKGEIVEVPCGRQLIEGGYRCILHDPNAWRTHAEPIREEIKKQIKNDDLNFQKYHLPEIDFSKIVKEFNGPVDFRETHFHGDVNFTRIIFSRDADFRVTMFIGEAAFDEVTFSGDLGFGGAKFSGNAEFEGTTFSGDAWFGWARFSGDAQFDRAKFLGETQFDNSSFLRRSRALFRLTRFHEIVSIDRVDMSGVHFYFRNTLFERGISVDEDKWSKSGYRLLTENSDLYSAIDSYQSLIVGFRNMGHYEVAGELVYRKMICRKNILTRETFILTPSIRIIFPEKLRRVIRPFYRIDFIRLFLHSIWIPFRVRIGWRNLIKWIWMIVFHISCGFGERPINVIRGSILTIFLFIGLYIPIVEPYKGWGR